MLVEMSPKKIDDKNKTAPVAKKDKVVSSSKSKPVFPAYVPSHLEVNNRKDEHGESSSRDIYETNQLYVTNLPAKTNMAEMSRLFPECVGIALDVNDKSESHAAYLEFTDTETAQRVCQNTRGTTLRGNTLIIAPKLKYI